MGATSLCQVVVLALCCQAEIESGTKAATPEPPAQIKRLIEVVEANRLSKEKSFLTKQDQLKEQLAQFKDEYKLKRRWRVVPRIRDGGKAFRSKEERKKTIDRLEQGIPALEKQIEELQKEHQEYLSSKDLQIQIFERLTVGAVGILDYVEKPLVTSSGAAYFLGKDNAAKCTVVDVVDEKNAIISVAMPRYSQIPTSNGRIISQWKHDAPQTVWITGIDTSKMVDGRPTSLLDVFFISGTKKYLSAR